MKVTVFAVTLCLLSMLFISCEDPRGSYANKYDPTKDLKGGTLLFSDDFERKEIGADWSENDRWTIKNGRLHISNDHNKGLWLLKELPNNARVEFDAKSTTKEGDLKCEIFAAEPTHQSGYILVFGGWDNRINIIARLDEHGEDRKEERERRVVLNKTHTFTIIRRGKSLAWFVDGTHLTTYDDPEPLKGRYFGFNDWEAPVSYDNLKVYQLGY
jgi:hypothetical protein